MGPITKLSELAEYIAHIVNSFSQKDYEQLHQELLTKYQQLIMEALLESHPNWSILRGNSACMMFLYRNWLFQKTAEGNAQQLLILAEEISTNYKPSSEEFLTAEIAELTFQVVDQIYDFSNCILKDRHMFVFLLNAVHSKEDAFCRTFLLKNSGPCADIYMFSSIRDSVATLPSILLHELGHCVALALTGDTETIPEDFPLLPSLLGLNIPPSDMPEFFAHCFAMSLLYEPALQQYDPFQIVPLAHKQLLRMYFKHKIDNHKN